MALEIEFRARFDEAMYETVRSRLQRQGDDLGVDDKHIYFYVLPDKLLKQPNPSVNATDLFLLTGLPM